MKREIIFRGKETEEGNWKYGDVMNFPNGCANISEQNEEREFSFTVNPDTVGQYIGLTDKNDAKIFEGDILRSDNYPFNNKGYDNYYAEVVYWDNLPCCCGYMTRRNPNLDFVSGISHGNCQSFEDIEEGKGFEIIGNIHDNPELLTK